ncbi:MAG: aspartate aminotransferase family protein [Desulfobulbus propionicus]|nr:MAG: aspartate aminotransferase family protein [Desulfobulbus propionicus]
MNNSDWQTRGDQVFIETYSRFPAAMVKGEGCRLWDAEGREYLDFLAGIAVCSLGHCHPAVTAAIREQAGRVVHISNLFHSPPQIELAELLVANTFADRVFMGNSGAEANEAAIKLARIHSAPGRYQIISLEGSFHGRTLATVAATGQPRFHRGFEPLPDGFIQAPFNDIQALERCIGKRTCAVLCEPIQGESGVLPLDKKYLGAIRELCDRHGLLLIFDEVQTGMGRTGRLFAYEELGVVPDIMTSAKALGNGLPIGAMLTRESIAASLGVGTHASTFGGNPVAAAAAVAVLRTMLADGFFAGVRRRGQYLADRLGELSRRFPGLTSDVRGRGLLLGMVLTPAGVEVGPALVQRMFEEGVLINFAGNRVLRFAPPLTVSEAEIEVMLERLTGVLEEFS